MRFLNFKYKEKIFAGVFTADGRYVLKIEDILSYMREKPLLYFIQNHSGDDMTNIQNAVICPNEGTSIPVYDITILAPIQTPCHDILCIGENYLAHAEEVKRNFDDYGLERQEYPIYFSKRACSILGNEEPIIGRFDLDKKLDYEVELAVIIGKNGKDIKKQDAESYIFGYSVFNDVSSREIQKRHTQWFKGKSLDTYSVMGPVIVTKDEFTFPPELEVVCRVNGEERQKSNTRLLLTDIASIIQELSSGMTLMSGDIIATGTPAGVAIGMAPQCFFEIWRYGRM